MIRLTWPGHYLLVFQRGHLEFLCRMHLLVVMVRTWHTGSSRGLPPGPGQQRSGGYQSEKAGSCSHWWILATAGRKHMPQLTKTFCLLTPQSVTGSSVVDLLRPQTHAILQSSPALVSSTHPSLPETVSWFTCSSSQLGAGG